MIQDSAEKIKRLFRSRSLAYLTIFNKQSIDAKIVLRDLAHFCRANETTFHKDPRMHAVIEGRREVWLRIQEYLNLTPDEVIEFHKIRSKGGE